MNYFDDPALDNPFWRFSLDRYERPGVAPVCLALQDRVQVDVNLLLFAFWLGHEGRRVTNDPVRLEIVTEWHETVVKPLRHSRITRKPTTGLPEDPIRTAIKQVELQSEQIEQALLYNQAEDLVTEPGADAQCNMIHNARRLIPTLAVEDDVLGQLAALCH